jgi:indolepyruvate ferredoxin oxidoreductase alpha subunit
MAGGLSRAPQGRRPHQVVATIGDSTFYHAGIPALVNAVHTNTPLVLVIMDNSVTAMTGGQPTPATGHLADGSPAKVIEMEKLVRGCGVGFIEVVDPYDYDSLKQTLGTAKRYTFEQGMGVAVVITRRPCIRTPNVEIPAQRFKVNENCDLCMTCVRDLECPAISYVKGEKRMEINTDLCAGCGFCVRTCPAQAIEAKGSS